MSIDLLLIELKDKVKSGAIWSAVWILLGFIMALVFEPMRKALGEQGSSQILELFPQEMLDSFNIGEDYLTKIESFIGGEFLTFFLLAGAIYGVFLGGGTIFGKIKDKTLTNTLTKNISRKTVYLTKLTSNTIYLAITTLIIAIGVYIAFAMVTSDDMSAKFFVVAFFGSFVLHSFFAVLGQTLGLVLNNKPQMIGAVFAGFTWFMDSLSRIDGYPKELKYFSPFYYLNINTITQDFAIDWGRLIILIGMTLILIVLGMKLWDKKDVYI